MEQAYLNNVTKQFQYYKVLGERTFAQLSEEQMMWDPGESSNSVAIIVNHMVGNMLSRFTDFLTSDGEKEWRHRDQEFEPNIKTAVELRARWEEGWNCLFAALETINLDNFHTYIYIRNQRHSIMEALNRQLAHYSYHIGQIVFIGKLIKGAEWRSLTIPKGESQEFNHGKFSQPPTAGHFTDDFLATDTEAGEQYDS